MVGSAKIWVMNALANKVVSSTTVKKKPKIKPSISNKYSFIIVLCQTD